MTALAPPTAIHDGENVGLLSEKRWKARSWLGETASQVVACGQPAGLCLLNSQPGSVLRPLVLFAQIGLKQEHLREAANLVYIFANTFLEVEERERGGEGAKESGRG